MQPCLLLLLLEHPDHGYALLERLKCFLPAEGDPGSVYRALHALEVIGAVRSTWGLSESGPARRTYHLTEIGQAQLEEWAHSISDTREALEAYLRRYAGKAGAVNGGVNGAATACSAGVSDTAPASAEPPVAPRPAPMRHTGR
ncbi:MAG: helix-turn-helix transcriptional regulator [Geodermatophilaceae bacterium]|nr:helix-turn-helix transcriptional regulator [Geodermatophilaceae bacterium]